MKRYAFFLMVLVWTLPARCAANRPLYRIETVAGSAQNGDGSSALAAQMGNIQGIAVDTAGNLYLADTDHHRVRKVDTAGVIRTIAGTGAAGFSGDGGPATAASLNLPYGLAVDSSGTVYLADLGNNRVRRITPDGKITTVAGNGSRGSGGDGALATAAQLLTPRNVALDSAGNLYIAEFEGHRIRRVSPDGKISTVAGNGTVGLRGDGGPAISAQLAYPAGLAFDRFGALYIADSQNNRIRRVQSGIMSTVVPASAAAGVTVPVGVALDPNGTLYMADIGSNIQAYSSGGAWVTNFAGTGIPGFSGDGGPASKATLSVPHDLAVDSSGNLFIADGARVRKVDRLGQIQTVAGDALSHSLGDGGKAVDALLQQPSAVALDPSGNLYIADTGTNRVRRVLPSGAIMTFAGTGEAASGPSQVAAWNSALNGPTGVAVDSSGDVLIADTFNHRVRKVVGGSLVTNFAGTGEAGAGSESLVPQETQLRWPRAVCAGRGGTVYVVDSFNHRVLRVDPGSVMRIAAGNGSPGDAGDGGQARVAQLNEPGACAVDSFGSLFVADTLNHRIRKISPTGVISTVAGTGEPGSEGDEGPAVSARLHAPRGVAVTDSGDLYIADTGSHRIRQVTPDGTIHTIAGGTAAGFAGDGGPAGEALLNTPLGLLVDGGGALYFADSKNNRVRCLTPGAEPAPPPVLDPIVLPEELTALNAASLAKGPIAPGELIVLKGAGLGPILGVSSGFDHGLLPTLLGGTQVRFDGVAAPLIYAQAGQVVAQVPYSVSGDSTLVEVFYQEYPAGDTDVPVAASAPGLFPLVMNPDGSPNSAANPAARGAVVTFYATGEGLTDQAASAGTPAQAPLAHPKLPLGITIAGTTAEIVTGTSAPGQVGTLQVQARVPTKSTVAGPAPVRLTVGSSSSPELTVWLK